MSLHFEQPAFLWLVALILPLAAIAWWGFGAMAGVRRWSAIACRGLLLVLLAAMLAGASSIRKTDRLAVVALVDVSGSVRSFFPPATDPSGESVGVIEQVRRFLARATDRRGADDLVGIVVFGGSSLTVASCREGAVADRPLDIPMREGTDIASAIRMAQGLFPPDAARRFLLVTDGNQTSGDALAAARETARAGKPIPIDVVPLSYEVVSEVQVESVESPTRAPAGASVTVRIVLSSTGPASGTLRLLNEGQDVDINGPDPGSGRRIDLPPGRTALLFGVPLGPGRVHRFEAVFEPVEGPAGGDTIASNNRARSFTLTPGAGSALLIDGVSQGAPDGPGALLARTLRSEGVEVDVVSPEAAPADLLRLQAYDAVVLQNVSAEAMAPGVNSLLARYVTEIGGGLVMIGGPDSFGPGGWKGTPIESILPVRLDLPERLVMPAAAVVFIIDKSGSMGRPVMGGSRSQQEIANDGAALAIRTLDKNDLVGVIAFDTFVEVVVPLAPLTDPQKVADRVLSIPASGGTDLPPAMEEAHAQLRRAQAKIKHAIILSDGQSRGSGGLPALAKKMADDGIKISCIAVGDSADVQTMSKMAALGGGEFYKVIDPNVLPRVFLKAVRVVRQPMIREEPFKPLIQAFAPLAEGMDAATMPLLNGLVLTQPKAGRDDSEAASVVYDMLAPGGEPVLAHWQAGLGQVAAFTSDAHHWAEPWLSWPGYRRMWLQVIRGVSRVSAGRTADLAVEIVGDDLRIRLEATSEQGRPLDMLTVPGAVYSPDGTRVEVRLAQTAPGVYEATIPAPASGDYVVTLTPKGSGPEARALPPVVGGAVKPLGAEYRTMQSNDALLRRLAAESGGRVLALSDPDAAARAIFDRSAVTPQEARTPLWPILLPIALAVLVLDIATRRIAWDRLLSREFGATLRREAEEAMRDRSGQAARTLESLRRADEAASASPSDKALGDQDAAALAEDARRRRREARLGRAPVPPAPAAAAPPPDQPESSLLAAKRRARERFEDDQQ